MISSIFSREVRHDNSLRHASGFPSQTIATLHRFLFGIAQATSCVISPKHPLGHFGATFWERRKFKTFGQSLKKGFCWTQSGKIWSVLHFWGLWVAEFCGNSAEASATRRLLSRKVHFWASKNSKKSRFGRKPYVNISGFLRQLRKICEGQNPSPNGPDCMFKRSQSASEVLQAFSPLTATNLLVLAVW